MSKPRITLYWEGGRPPAYLTLCVSSWLQFVELDQILVLNQSNVEKYIGDILSLQRLRVLSLAKQSDVVSAAYLAKFGGCFLDADTILTNENCLKFIDPNQDGTLKQFHYHIGALSVEANHPGLVHWAKYASKESESLQRNKPWNNVGNAIIDPFMGKPENKELVERWSVWQTQATPERIPSYWEVFNEGESPNWYYRNFWFKNQLCVMDIVQRLRKSPSGIVCLHNSWTPESFKVMSLSEVLRGDTPLAKVLTHFARLDEVDQIESKLTFGS